MLRIYDNHVQEKFIDTQIAYEAEATGDSCNKLKKRYIEYFPTLRYQHCKNIKKRILSDALKL